MKKTLLSLLLLVVATTISAQSLLLGDTDQNGTLTIADVAKTVDMVLYPETQQTFDLNPYHVDNSLVAGTWYMPDGTSFTLEADGTTTYPGGATYKFMPYQGLLMVYKANGDPLRALSLCEVSPESLLAVNHATGKFTRYLSTAPVIWVANIELNPSSLTLASGSTSQLTATVQPSYASNKDVTWASSNEEVATVDANGLITAVARGTCVITATAEDESGVSATCEVTVIQLVTSIALSSSTLSLTPGARTQLSATVLPDDANNTNVRWTSSNTWVATVYSGVVTTKNPGTCIISCTAQDGSGVRATCELTVLYTGTDSQDYVDLGLPSGTLWATCNIGATKPEDYGDYFAWAEIEGNKTDFSWSTYEYGRPGLFKKYQSHWTDNNGAPDEPIGEWIIDASRLDASDDAAYVLWGTWWHIPSPSQLEELIDSSYTTTEWTMQNGVYGRKITSIVPGYEGNSIFLPAAGYRYDTSLNNAGVRGYYWSNEVVVSETCSYAYYLYSDESQIYKRSYQRCSGFSIRPVRMRTQLPSSTSIP